MEIYVERFRNRIHLFSPYDPMINALVKAMPGVGITKHRDGGGFKCWTLPLSWSTCLLLRETFRDMLVIGDRLERWATLERKRNLRARRVAASASIDLEKVAAIAPRLAAAMANRTHQQVGSAFAAIVRKSINADQPGLGKTLQAMGAILEANIAGPILVLAPQSALDITWQEELAAWLPQDAVYPLLGARDRRAKLLQAALGVPTPRTWVLANYEMLRVRGQPIRDPREGNVVGYQPPPWPELLDQIWAAIIVDESHRLLLTNTPTMEKQSLQRQGAMLLQTDGSDFKLALSGTPAKGRNDRLWGTLNWLYPQKFNSYNRWVDEYFEIYVNEATGDTIIEDIKPHKKKQFYRELDGVMIRRTKAEVAPDMHPKERAGWHLDQEDASSPVGVWLPMTAKQAKAYEEMRLTTIAQLEEGEVMANGVLAELTRLKQFANSYVELDEDGNPRLTLPSNKIDWLVPWLGERDIERGGDRYGSKVIIASQFAQFVNLMEYVLGKLGIPTLKITGENPRERKENKQLFQDPRSGYRVMLLSTTAGGVSLTLDQADDVVIMDETWDPTDQEQLEDRAHRLSRPDHWVTLWYIYSLGTLQEQIARDNEDMNTLTHQMLDGRRGVGRALKLVGMPTPKRKL